MATLTGNAINTSYQGLIKTDDNGAFGAAEKRVTDGLGNATNMTIGTGGTSFDSGTVNFTGATVTGLPSAAGLVSGTGTDSMQSAASLTTIAANASGADSIALGDGACATGNESIALGLSTNTATALGSVAIGARTSATGNGSIAIGGNSSSQTINATGACAIAIGQRMTVSGACAIGLGYRAETSALHGISIGTLAGGNSDCSIGIGVSANANAIAAVALGAGVTAAKADTVTVKELETCVAGGGIYLTTPDGLAQPKLTVNNSSELLIGGNPVGAAGLVSGTGADSMQSAASLTTVAANASGTCSIALGDGVAAIGNESITIGSSISAGAVGTIAIGKSWTVSANAFSTNNVLLGNGTSALTVGQDDMVALGRVGRLDSDGGVAIGCGATICGASNGRAIAIGYTSKGIQDCSIALGFNTCANAIGSVALGNAVTAAKAETVTVKELETCVAGGGITLKSADTTEEKMTLTDADVLAIGGDTVPANDTATPTVVNRIWSGTSAQYTALGTYDANTLYYVS